MAQLPSVADLADSASLTALFGPVASVERSSLPAAGLSGASHERITVTHAVGGQRHLVLKTVVPAESWTAYRTGDITGREALVLAEPGLQLIWDVLACPYLAYAIEPGRIGLLMEDLSPHLHPPDRLLLIEQEDTFLRGLAALHAHLWQNEAIALPWLAPLPVRFSILGPGAAEQELQHRPGHPLFRAVARGWELVLAGVPPDLRRLLLLPEEETAPHFANLPQTLLHGDAKAGNSAFLPNGQLALFDWATPGPGPATLDLYYFLAVDQTRHARPKEAIIAAYRSYLEGGLGWRLSSDEWDRLHRVGILGAARMLLWSKALAVERGEPGARSDWDWWIERLSSGPASGHDL